MGHLSRGPTGDARVMDMDGGDTYTEVDKASGAGNEERLWGSVASGDICGGGADPEWASGEVGVGEARREAEYTPVPEPAPGIQFTYGEKKGLRLYGDDTDGTNEALATQTTGLLWETAHSLRAEADKAAAVQRAAVEANTLDTLAHEAEIEAEEARKSGAWERWAAALLHATTMRARAGAATAELLLLIVEQPEVGATTEGEATYGPEAGAGRSEASAEGERARQGGEGQGTR